VRPSVSSRFLKRIKEDESKLASKNAPRNLEFSLTHSVRWQNIPRETRELRCDFVLYKGRIKLDKE